MDTWVFFDVFLWVFLPIRILTSTRCLNTTYRNTWLMINPITWPYSIINFQHQPVCINNTTTIVNQSLNHPDPPNLIYHATLQSVQARNSVWHGSYMAPCDIATRFHRCSNVERACPEKQTKPLIWTKEYQGKVEDFDEATGIMLMSLVYRNSCPKMNWHALDGNAWHEEEHRKFGISLYEEVS